MINITSHGSTVFSVNEVVRKVALVVVRSVPDAGLCPVRTQLSLHKVPVRLAAPALVVPLRPGARLLLLCLVEGPFSEETS